jgi:hypothetical protein
LKLPETAVAIGEHWKLGQVSHALDDVDELGPGRLVGVAVATQAGD